jgi:hypothetical protein
MSKSSAIGTWVHESGPRTVDELFSGVSIGRARLVQDGVARPLTPGSSSRLTAGIEVTVVAEINSVFPVTDVIGQVVREFDEQSPGAVGTVVTDGFCEAVSPGRGGLIELVVDGADIHGDSSLVLQIGLMRSRMTDEIPFHIRVSAAGD